MSDTLSHYLFWMNLSGINPVIWEGPEWMGLRQGKGFLIQVDSRLGTESGGNEWVLVLVLQESTLVDRLAESEGLKEVGKKLQNKRIAKLTVYPRWVLNTHFHDFSFKDGILFHKSCDLNAKDRLWSCDSGPITLSKASALQSGQGFLAALGLIRYHGLWWVFGLRERGSSHPWQIISKAQWSCWFKVSGFGRGGRMTDNVLLHQLFWGKLSVFLVTGTSLSVSSQLVVSLYL